MPRLPTNVDGLGIITQVEFYVGSDLRDADTSTPYEFKLDTLEVEDGELKVTFAAYTSDGKSTKKALSLTVDNGVSKGAEFHVQQGEEFLRNSKWDDAINAGRVALKAKKGFNPARMVLARAYMGKNVFRSRPKVCRGYRCRRSQEPSWPGIGRGDQATASVQHR